MDLYKTFGEIFGTNPKDENREMLIKKVYQDWVIFKHLTPDDMLFTAYDDLIDAQLDQLSTLEYGYYEPKWINDYKAHSKIYYAPMEVKINRKDLCNFQNYEFSKN